MIKSPEVILNSPYREAMLHIEAHARDRPAMVALKMAIETAKKKLRAENPKGYGRSATVRNNDLTDMMVAVDANLRNIRGGTHAASTQTAEGAPAWIYSLVITTGDDQFFSQVASMLNPAQFHARECKKAEHVHEVPVILQFIQQPDLQAIHTELWDDTCPLNQIAGQL